MRIVAVGFTLRDGSGLRFPIEKGVLFIEKGGITLLRRSDSI